MKDPEKVLSVVGEWVAKAENDLKTARQMLKLGEDCPTDIVCFHAQQCAEKYIKALLVLDGIDFPKTHHIARLNKLLPARFRLGLTVEEQRRLTDYATGARYPGWDEIPLGEARRAVALARRVRKGSRALLPARGLRRRRNR